MEQNENNVGITLGDIGCRFRSNIENHIKDYKLQKENDIEWLMEPLDLIRYPNDLVIDAFRKGDHLGWVYELYFHYRDASLIYVPFNPPYEKFNEYEDIFFDLEDEEQVPDANPYNKTMLVKGLANWPTIKAVPKIWHELTISFTEMGIWQALLLHEAYTFLPKGWHGDYFSHWYVFSQDDMRMIVEKYKNSSRDFNREKLASYLGRQEIMPSVKIDGDKAIVTYYFWNKWKGLCKRIVPVERNNLSVEFGKGERQVLVEYDCGIRY